MTLFIPATEDKALFVKPKQKLKVLFLHEGVVREAFWLKYTKKGDFLSSSHVKANRRMRAIAHVANERVVMEKVVEIPRDELGVRPHNYLTLHPSDLNAGHSKAAVNGPGGIHNTSFDLRTMPNTKEILVVHLTKPEMYPLSFSKDSDVRFEGVYRGFRRPVFHIYATAVKDNFTLDVGAPFIAGQSADFVMETSSFECQHMLVQIRLQHPFDGFCFDSHAFFVPSAGDIPGP